MSWARSFYLEKRFFLYRHKRIVSRVYARSARFMSRMNDNARSARFMNRINDNVRFTRFMSRVNDISCSSIACIFKHDLLFNRVLTLDSLLRFFVPKIKLVFLHILLIINQFQEFFESLKKTAKFREFWKINYASLS